MSPRRMMTCCGCVEMRPSVGTDTLQDIQTAKDYLREVGVTVD